MIARPIADREVDPERDNRGTGDCPRADLAVGARVVAVGDQRGATGGPSVMWLSVKRVTESYKGTRYTSPQRAGLAARRPLAAGRQPVAQSRRRPPPFHPTFDTLSPGSPDGRRIVISRNEDDGRTSPG